jgi:hypothetical protein
VLRVLQVFGFQRSVGRAGSITVRGTHSNRIILTTVKFRDSCIRQTSMRVDPCERLR